MGETELYILCVGAHPSASVHFLTQDPEDYKCKVCDETYYFIVVERYTTILVDIHACIIIICVYCREQGS